MDELKKNREQLEELDSRMAELFEERMKVCEAVANYKKENALPVLDEDRERILLEKNAARVSDPGIREHYIPFFLHVFR